MKRTYRIEIFPGQGRILPGWYVRLVGGNGETVSISESFTTKWSAKRSARKQAEVLGVAWAEVER